MTNKERRRRPDPQRTGPIRNWGTLFKTPDGGNADMRQHDANSHGHDHDQSPWDTVISRAVETGYKVIEDQIHQGRHFAQQFGGSAFTPGQATEEDTSSQQGNVANELMERVMHFYSDMGSLCFDMLDSVASNPGFGDLMRSAMPTAAGGNSNRSPDANPAAVTIEIVSPTPVGVRCCVDWLSPSQEHALAIGELRALDPACPSLTQIEFVPAQEKWLPVLRVTIPADQPPGNYSGMAVDAKTNVPCATILLEIPQHGAAS